MSYFDDNESEEEYNEDDDNISDNEGDIQPHKPKEVKHLSIKEEYDQDDNEDDADADEDEEDQDADEYEEDEEEDIVGQKGGVDDIYNNDDDEDEEGMKKGKKEDDDEEEGDNENNDNANNNEEGEGEGRSKSLKKIPLPQNIHNKYNNRDGDGYGDGNNEDNSEDNSDSDDDNGDSDDDDNKLQKFDKDIKKNYVLMEHPECNQQNYNEIIAMTKVVRDKSGMIIDPLHKTMPWLTKYERARILGQRAKQINSGSNPFIEIPKNIINGYTIAEMELAQKKIPYIIRRPLPNGGSEYWMVEDLEQI